MMNLTQERKKVSKRTGEQSLVGTVLHKTYPLSWGNYFWLADGSGRVANMWVENLNALFLEDGLVEGVQFIEDDKTWFLIDDKRIPDEWYYPQLCFTGYYRPCQEILKEMLTIRPNSEGEAKWL